MAGEGSSSDLGLSEVNEHTDLQHCIAADLQSNIKHKPVKVPCHQNPFDKMDPALHTVFENTLAAVQDAGFLPDGFGVCMEEWENHEYPTHESLKVGRKGKNLHIGLPVEVWLQGLWHGRKDCSS
ncbi:hypothetical protein K439DRAFT_1614718 [Ramaria rubella]|nr:hypothetical protein K439DRAFT_1614718 [Ramaria rubella]